MKIDEKIRKKSKEVTNEIIEIVSKKYQEVIEKMWSSILEEAATYFVNNGEYPSIEEKAVIFPLHEFSNSIIGIYSLTSVANFHYSMKSMWLFFKAIEKMEDAVFIGKKQNMKKDIFEKIIQSAISSQKHALDLAAKDFLDNLTH